MTVFTSEVGVFPTDVTGLGVTSLDDDLDALGVELMTVCLMASLGVGPMVGIWNADLTEVPKAGVVMSDRVL